MDIFSTRPERIIGNIALASLLAGIPLGLVISAIAAIFYHQQYSGFELFKNVALGALVAPFYISVCGIVILAPLLALLRRYGYGGPFFVYLISAAMGLPFLSNGLMSGLAVLALALAASFAFCRFAYPRQAYDVVTGLKYWAQADLAGVGSSRKSSIAVRTAAWLKRYAPGREIACTAEAAERKPAI